MPREAVVAIVGDIHANSVVGLMPADGIVTNNGLTKLPSPGQLWIWQAWLDYWSRISELRQGRDLYVILNGDLVEGYHHQSTQFVCANPSDQQKLALKCLSPAEALRPEFWFLIRGTKAHAGPEASAEEAIGEILDSRQNVEREPGAGNYSWWHLRLDINGVRMDIKHHGRRGYRPWTSGSAINLLAAQISYRYIGVPADKMPHLAIRSHVHLCRDSYDNAPVRAVTTPAWQLATEFTHRLETLSDIGGIVVVCSGGKYNLDKYIYKPKEDTVWHSTSRKPSSSKS